MKRVLYSYPDSFQRVYVLNGQKINEGLIDEELKKFREQSLADLLSVVVLRFFLRDESVCGGCHLTPHDVTIRKKLCLQ